MRQANVVVASTLLAAALAAAATASAQTRPGAQPKPAIPELEPGLPAKSYLRLFEQAAVRGRSAALRATMRSNFMRPNSARRFICGTHLLPADSSINPTFEKAPADKSTRFSMRIVTPSVCR